MKLFKTSLISLLLASLAFLTGSCVREEFPDNRDKDFGYVQFKLYKTPQQTKSEPLEYLGVARKVRVNMTFGEETIFQTLTLEASSDAAAEFGLRSQKLQLVPGTYQVLSFELYDGMNQKIYDGPSSGSFEIVAGGLQVHDLFADTKPRGSVKFSLVKEFQTKATAREYTFDEIKSVDIIVKNTTSGLMTSFKGLKTKFSLHFEDESDDNEKQTSSIVCDTLLSLEGGSYEIATYRVYDDSKELLEINDRPASSPFEVKDNRLTEADVRITLRETDAYIKDYNALHEIWLALNGPEWYYIGESMPKGCNWNFNKDIDLWGDQPGVTLHPNGRVAAINISDFGFSGKLPAAIGQLSELVELYLGSHNDFNLFDTDFIGPDSPVADRMTAAKLYFSQLHPATPFSEPIAMACMENKIDIPEIAMYKTLSEDKIINKKTGEPIIRPMDTRPGVLANGLESIDPAIGKLKKLEKLFIANGKLKELPAEMKNLEGLTDIEVYNCPEMKHFPMVLAEMPALISLNLANNPQWSSEEILKGTRAICNGAAQKEIQIWYMGFNNLTVFPKEIRNLEKIGLLDLSYNKIGKIEAMLGPSIKFVNLGLSYNQISDESWPANPEGELFFGYDDLESLSFSHNNMQTFPNIFTSELNYAMKSADFSFNDLRRFPEDFKGINVETLVLANNPNLGKLTDVFAKSNSMMRMINLRGCGISEIDPDAFHADRPEVTASLVSLDLSYNHLTEFPAETFHPGNLPYLFGVDVSYNRFSHFPIEVFPFTGLTVMAIRGQRDADGNRCLREWPNGYADTNWRGLYLGSNDIRKVEDRISPFCYQLDISDNPNIIFDASDICGPIQAQVFVLIYDKTQDIRNCPVLLN